MDLINNQRCNYFSVTKSLVIHRPHKSDQIASEKLSHSLRTFHWRVYTEMFSSKSGTALLQNHGESEVNEHLVGPLSKRKRRENLIKQNIPTPQNVEPRCFSEER